MATANQPPLVTQASQGYSPPPPGPPATVSLQPEPEEYSVAHKTVGLVTMTAVKRNWRPGDADRCRLCPRDQCVVDPRDTCVVLLPRYVDIASARLAPLERSPGDRLAGLRVDAGTHGA